MKTQRGSGGIVTLSLTSVLDGRGWLTKRPGRFSPGKDPVSIVYEAGWAPGPVWTVAKNLAPHPDSIPDRPAYSVSQHRLSYRQQEIPWNNTEEFLISKFRRVLNLVCILLGISPASDCGLLTFRNPLSVPSSRVGCQV